MKLDPVALQLGLSAFAAILAVLNPFSIVPVFLGVTQELKPAVRRAMALVVSIFVLVALNFALFFGAPVLKFFGISIPAFQIAGGILLFSTGLAMIRGTGTSIEKFAATDTTGNSLTEARARFRDLIVPFGTPLFVGPGSISTAVLYGSRAANSDRPAESLAAVSIACFACAIAAWMVLFGADGIAKILRQSGIYVLSRLMGLILCAISVQFVLSGLATVLPKTVILPAP